jgi:uncharacterized protein YjcR
MTKSEKPKKRPALQRQIDWAVIKTEYVTSLCTYHQLAEKYGVSTHAVEQRGHRGQWRQERQFLSDSIQAEAEEIERKSRLKQLLEMNKRDISLAESMKSIVSVTLTASVKKDKDGKIIGTNLTPQNIASLSNAVASAQRVARLAIDASTENTENTSRGGLVINAVMESSDEDQESA